MRTGKLDNDKLNALILSKFRHVRPEVVCSPQVGVDCAAVELSGRLAVMSTDPITSAVRNIGILTVHVSCNDAAAAGAEPVGLLVTLLVPPSATEEDIGRTADELAAAAEHANVDIIGGHTEVTASVTRIVTCATVIAKSGEHGLILPGGMKEGDDIILTKWAGLEGTAVIAADYRGRLEGFTAAELDEAAAFIDEISVVKEGLIAARNGAHAMHDVTEGGVFGAAWEMSEASGCGVTVYEEAVPVHPLTKRMCAELGLDPMRLLSSGAMLIAAKDGDTLVSALEAHGVKATVIGKACGKGVRDAGGNIIEAPGADELYRL